MIQRYSDSTAPAARADGGTPWSKRNVLLTVAVGFASFFFYSFILNNYYYGDPAYYQRYYDYLSGRGPIWALQSQFDYLGSSELIYPLIAWAGSNFSVERYIFMAAFDGILYGLLIFVLRKYECNTFFISLCLTNFYIVVLATSAERLKFAYIFFLLALLTAGRIRLLCLTLAPLAHFQSLISYASLFVFHFFTSLSPKAKFAIGVAAFFGALTFSYFFYGAILGKVTAYQGQGGLLDLVSALALVAVAVSVFPNRIRVLATFIPLIILTFILGSDRMNMITFTIFFYICLLEKKTMHPAVIMIMGYFSFKSIGFINNVLIYGNGFI